MSLPLKRSTRGGSGDKLTEQSADSLPTESTVIQTRGSGQKRGRSSDPVLACTNCRRRKLKCSRQKPTCQQCRKAAIECEYSSGRSKTGMKAGAIDTLHKRIDPLETRLQGYDAVVSRCSRNHTPVPTQLDDHSILSFFANKLKKFNDDAGPDRQDDQCEPSAKPGRGDYELADSRLWLRNSVSTPERPDDEALDSLLQAYFSHIHPWIPMIHQGRLRKRIQNPGHEGQRYGLDITLTAIRLAAARFIDDHDIATRCLEESPENQAQIQDWIILQAMKRPCVESLQALTILVFHNIGSGEASSTWSIIGSLTRTAEYLQLTVEQSGRDGEPRSLIQPHTTLQPTQDWTEEEERRRVFWTIFNLDRYCSVTMGWNTSLTSHDVSRRLPCDGLLWRKERPVSTPFFGIWDTGTSRMGNPISCYPSHSSQPNTDLASQEVPSLTSPVIGERQAPSSNTSPPMSWNAGRVSDTIDMSTVGAFAYSIEATESLSRVTTYFLQQPRLRDDRDLPSWITRFKELDLRLVHWKMLLPYKWKADNVTHRVGLRMDPNLTLAHITHNASMILLHQVIAFPLPEWNFFKHRLPSSLSIDTCQSAAVEIATIARNFLNVMRRGNEAMPVAPLFTFCVYIAGRFLLLLWHLHWRGPLDLQISPQFWELLDVLQESGMRWSGLHGLDLNVRDNLATKYLNRLQSLHAKCVADPKYHVDPLGYTSGADDASPSRSSTSSSHQQSTYNNAQAGSDDTSAPERLHNSQQHRATMQASSTLEKPQAAPYAAESLIEQTQLQNPQIHLRPGLASVPPGEGVLPFNGGEQGDGGMDFMMHMLMDQEFMDLDRVISYQDGVFGPEFDASNWWPQS